MAEQEPTTAYRRILLKLSGEALMGKREFGLDWDVVSNLAGEVKEIRELGVDVALVIGAGNIFRGVSGVNHGMDRVASDHMGMLATIINSLAMQNALERRGVETRVMSAIEVREVAEPYIRRRAVRHLERGRVIIIAAGTGNPYFTTDTAAALRAMEIHAEVILKGTKVDGVYSSDPRKHADAVRLEKITYLDVLQRGLRVMDSTAISLCMENSLPIIVFDLTTEGNILKVVRGEPIGSIIGGPENGE